MRGWLRKQNICDEQVEFYILRSTGMPHPPKDLALGCSIKRTRREHPDGATQLLGSSRWDLALRGLRTLMVLVVSLSQAREAETYHPGMLLSLRACFPPSPGRTQCPTTDASEAETR